MVDSYKEVLKGNDEALSFFETGMANLVKRFCANMQSGQDFTLKAEIHGNNGSLIHFRSFDDVFARPKEKRKKV